MTNFTDSRRLAETSYATSAPLESRRSLYSYLDRPIDIGSEIISRCRNAKSLLEIGCGSGFFAQTLIDSMSATNDKVNYVGTDISEEFVFDLTRRYSNHSQFQFQTASAEALPFNESKFDVCIAQHMLYHVPSIQNALVEVRRVLKPDGKLVATMNSRETKSRIYEQIDEIAAAIGMPKRPKGDERFCVENAEQFLESAFSTSTIEIYERQFRVSEPSCVTRWVDSTRSFWEPIPRDNDWNEMLTELRSRISKEIQSCGVFVDQHRIGIAVAVK